MSKTQSVGWVCVYDSPARAATVFFEPLPWWSMWDPNGVTEQELCMSLSGYARYEAFSTETEAKAFAQSLREEWERHDVEA